MSIGKSLGRTGATLGDMQMNSGTSCGNLRSRLSRRDHMPAFQLGKLGRPFGDDGALAERDLSKLAVERQPITLANSLLADRHLTMLLIERKASTTNEAHLSKLTRNDSGMCRPSAGRGQDSIRYRISANVRGRGIRSRQDRRFSAIDKFLGLRVIEGDAPAGALRARRGLPLRSAERRRQIE